LDIKTLESKIMTLWQGEISSLLPQAIDVTESGGVKPEGWSFPRSPDIDCLTWIILLADALRHTLTTLTSVLPPISNQIVGILKRRCCDGLLPVRFIPSQFRAMVNKRSPTEPSYFVASILQPLKTFFALGTNDGLGASLRDDFLKVFAEEVFDAVCHRYVIGRDFVKLLTSFP
jgi:hypothetical protein